MHTIHGHATRQSELWCRASSEQEAVPRFGGQRPSPKTVLVVHLEHDLRDLFDGADHHHQGGARCAAGQRCINAAGAASLPPPQRSHTVQPDRRLHSTSGWRLSADANRCVLYACSKAELGSSMLAISSMFRPPVCTRWWWWPHGSRWGCMRTLSLVSRAMWLSQPESAAPLGCFWSLLVGLGGDGSSKGSIFERSVATYG